MNDLTAFQRDILYIIAGTDMPHGLKIKAELEEYYDNEVNHGRLYPNLDTLAEQGLLIKGKRDKRTNTYSLTQQGEDFLETRRQWENTYYTDDVRH